MIQNPFDIPDDIMKAEEKRQLENEKIRKGKNLAQEWLIVGASGCSTAEMILKLTDMAAALNLINARETENALAEQNKKPAPVKSGNDLQYRDSDGDLRATNALRAIKGVMDLYGEMPNVPLTIKAS